MATRRSGFADAAGRTDSAVEAAAVAAAGVGVEVGAGSVEVEGSLDKGRKITYNLIYTLASRSKAVPHWKEHGKKSTEYLTVNEAIRAAITSPRPRLNPAGSGVAAPIIGDVAAGAAAAAP